MTTLTDITSTDLLVADVQSAPITPNDVAEGRDVLVKVLLSADGKPFNPDRWHLSGPIDTMVPVEVWDASGCVLRGYVEGTSRLLVAQT